MLFLRSSFFAVVLNYDSTAAYIQGRFAEANLLYERCQSIDEKILGPEHPSLAITLNNRAELLREQVRATNFSTQIVVVLCGFIARM